MSDREKEIFKNCQSVDEVKKLVGETFFDLKTEQFDQINVSFVELYNHHLGRLEKLLSLEQQGLVEELRALPEPLYWRQVSKGTI